MELLLVILVPFLSAVISPFIGKRYQRWLEYLAVISGFIEFVLGILIVKNVIELGSYFFSSHFSVNALESIIILIVAFIGFLASCYSVGYLRREQAKGILGYSRVRQYYIFLHFFLAAMFLAINTTNPIIMWISIEATTLSTAFLISFYNKPTAMEAAWKYLIINSVGLLLGFFGTILFFAALPNTDAGFLSWKMFTENAAQLNPDIAKIAFIFILIGYGTKIGLVPMHTWKPDTYAKAPIPIVAIFSSSLLNVALLAVLRFKNIIDQAVGPEFAQNLLILFGIISIVIPALIMLTQHNYKRLLAYSSIEQSGIIVLGFAFGGLATFGAILHMIFHSLAKAALFLLSGNIFLQYSSTKIANVKNMLRFLPATSILFFIAVLAVAGIPPSGLFLTEFYIFSTGIASHLAVSIVAIVSIAIVFIGFLKVTSALIFERDEEYVNHTSHMENKWLLVPSVIILVVFVILSLFLPSTLRSLIESASTLYQ